MAERLRYAIEQRLRFIDFLLAEYGHINRSALMDYFGISAPQATNDINDYRDLAPGNLVYDLPGKTYRRAAGFQRVWA